MPIVLRAIWVPYWLKRFLFRFVWFCNIKKYNFFQFFGLKVVCKSLFFHDLASSIFKKSHVVSVVASCIDEVIVAVIVFWVSIFDRI